MALPNEDAAEVMRRFEQIGAELAPKTEMGRALALRAATLTVRLERCYRNDSARLGLAVDSALARYDHARLDELDSLMNGLESNPHRNAVLLQRTPGGVAHTIAAWQTLLDELNRPGRPAWSDWHLGRAEGLMGRTRDEEPRSRMRELIQALCHRFHALPEGEWDGLDEAGKYEHARREMRAIVTGRIEALTGFRSKMDLAAEARARAGAADRALFDDSKEAILARKYEAATERSLFRTLRELRQVEAEAEATAGAVETCEELGSSLPDDPAAIEGPDPAAPAVPSALEEAASAPRRRRPDPEKLRKRMLAEGRKGVRG